MAEIVGADLKKPMKFADIDSGNVNPKLGQSNKFDTNCALSVVTAEARARGINVRALGVKQPEIVIRKGKEYLEIPASYQLGNDMAMAWIDPKTGNAPIIKQINISDCKDVLYEINKLTAKNGRYYIGFDGTKLNHALNAYRINGKLYIYDQQINGSYDLLKALKEKGATTFDVLRLDNLLFNTTFIDKWITNL